MNKIPLIPSAPPQKVAIKVIYSHVKKVFYVGVVFESLTVKSEIQRYLQIANIKRIKKKKIKTGYFSRILH